jgi:3-phosphoshikimate 1-carboxyvinyltransferase
MAAARSAGRVEIDGGLSSQYVSALLMAAACGTGPIEVALTGSEIGARGYVDLTVAAMREPSAPRSSRPMRPPGGSQPTGYRATDFADRARRLGRDLSLGGGGADRRRHRPRHRPMPSPSPTRAPTSVIASFPHLPAVIDGSQMQDAVPTLAVLAAFNARRSASSASPTCGSRNATASPRWRPSCRASVRAWAARMATI